MNSKIIFAVCLIGFVTLISAAEDHHKQEIQHVQAMVEMPEAEADSDAPHDRVRRQWGYGMGYPMMGMGGYGMGMYRPYGMGMYGMYRPWGMMGMYG
uniref:Uncharacterized protein n=1 Tax=Panagrolaimus sp. ES5 TaxID=591445 RepID=A0AC34FL18_9BILA